MFCRKCGSNIKDNAVFCSKCGEKVEFNSDVKFYRKIKFNKKTSWYIWRTFNESGK